MPHSKPPVDCTEKCMGPCEATGYCPHEEWERLRQRQIDIEAAMVGHESSEDKA